MFALRGTLSLPMHRVLDNSVIEGVSAITWLMDDRVKPVRKACLLNILAMLCVTPAEEPLIGSVISVFNVHVDSIYVRMFPDTQDILEDLVTEPTLPFYRDATPPLAVHRALLEHLPEFDEAVLHSYRAEGHPSMQIVIAETSLGYTVADIDLDLFNPLQDVAGFFGHMYELLTREPTNHLTLRLDKRSDPFRCYTLDA